MKLTKYALLAAAAACSSAFAADTAYTTPVGYTTQALTANTFNLFGLNVQKPTLAAGQLTAVSGADVTDADVDFTTALPVGKMCVLEITSGTAAGTVQEFTVWSGSTITLPAAVSGVAIGDTYSVRVAPTLQETFTVGAGALVGSAVATTADKVWVPTGPGTYVRYWYKTIAPNIGWHTTTTGANDTGVVSADVPLVYIDGVLIEKKGAAGSLVVSGEVKKTGSNVLIAQGFNLISVNPPAGATLFTFGLDGDITGSAVATTADIVWVPAGAGVYTKYWYKSIAPNIGWHTTTTGSNDAGVVASDPALPSSILIQRKSATPKVVTLNVPASYSSL